MGRFDQVRRMDGHTLVGIIHALIRESPVSYSAAQTLRAVAEGLGWEGAILWEPRDACLQPVSIWTRDGGGDTRQADNVESALADEAWRTGGPVWAEETALQTGQHGVVGSLSGALTPGLAFPVTIGERPAAVVELYGATGAKLDSVHTTLIDALGALLGDWQERIAFEQEQMTLASRLSVAEERQRLLANTSRVLSDSADEDNMLQGLTSALVPALADACSVHLVEHDSSIRRVATSAIPAITERVAEYDVDRYGVSLTDEAGVGASIRTGLGSLYSTITDALLASAAKSAEHLELMRSLRPTSAMVAPISGHGNTLGALTLVAADSERTYTSEDLALLEDIGRRAGVALAGARALRRERSLGVKLQSGLLPPRLPRPDWLDVAGRYRSGRPDTLVGGDFYDCFWTPGDRLMFGIGDVCGHGPEAATLTARIRYAAKGLAHYIDSPASMLDSINQMMIEDGEGSSQFTAVYGLIDQTSTGIRVSLTRAGHPPPLLVKASGEIEEIMGKGMLLGFYPEVGLSDETVDLRPGDMLFLHTDGLTDARNESEMFGEQRLRSILADSAAGKSADRLVSDLMRTITEYAPEPTDDIAMLAIGARVDAR